LLKELPIKYHIIELADQRPNLYPFKSIFMHFNERFVRTENKGFNNDCDLSTRSACGVKFSKQKQKQT